MTGVVDLEGDLNSQHISKQYDNELLEIRNRVLTLGGLVESQIESAVNALLVTKPSESPGSPSICLTIPPNGIN